MNNWKKDHATESECAAEHELVETVLDEFASNMGFKREGLPQYGLTKIVSTVAQVVRANTLGIDPELLRMDDDESRAQVLMKARAAVADGKPVLAIEGDRLTRLD